MLGLHSTSRNQPSNCAMSQKTSRLSSKGRMSNYPRLASLRFEGVSCVDGQSLELLIQQAAIHLILSQRNTRRDRRAVVWSIIHLTVRVSRIHWSPLFHSLMPLPMVSPQVMESQSSLNSVVEQSSDSPLPTALLNDSIAFQTSTPLISESQKKKC